MTRTSDNRTRTIARALRGLLLGCSLMGLTAGMAAAGDVRESHTIDRNKITLGDLFTGLSAREASIAVMRAPAPGGQIRFSAIELDQIALQYGVALTMSTGGQSIEIRREEASYTSTSDNANKGYALLPVALVTNPVVTGTTITLGDLVDGYFDGRQHKISDAPEPGKTQDIPVSTLVSLAQTYDLALDVGERDVVTVKRAGLAISDADLRDMLREEMLREFPGSQIDISLLDYDEPFYLPTQNRLADVFVASVQVNARQDRFQAKLFLPASDGIPRPASVRGELLVSQNYAAASDATRTREAGRTNDQVDPVARAKKPRQSRGEQPKGGTDRSQDTVTLTPQRTVNVIDEVVRMVDVFPGIPHQHMDAVLMDAPQPGKSTQLQTLRVVRIAEQMGYSVELPAHIDRITVQREGIPVSEKDLTDLLKAELISRGYSDDFRIQLQSRFNIVFLPIDKSLQDIQINRFNVSTTGNNFTARLMVPQSARETESLNLRGNIEHLVTAPVAAQSLQPGDIIRADMITWRTMPRPRRMNITDDASDLVGKTVKRAVLSGGIITADNVKRPTLISKGTPVTVEIRVAGMRIATMARAMSDGAMGDLIQVRNLKSEQMVDVRVVGANRVEPAIVALTSRLNTQSR